MASNPEARGRMQRGLAALLLQRRLCVTKELLLNGLLTRYIARRCRKFTLFWLPRFDRACGLELRLELLSVCDDLLT
jgi:hypothetical protein